jgi:hypothetical protein
MCGRGVKCPRCPAAVKGTKASKSHCHEKCMTGRRVSREPEAGKPIHRGSSRGDFYGYITFLNYSIPALPARHPGLQRCLWFVQICQLA